MTRRRESAPDFAAVQIEGGLLNGEYLGKVARLQAECQSAVDYQVPKGLRLRDELGRYWRIAQALWEDFEVVSARADLDPAVTEQRLLRPLLRDVLGFTDLEYPEPIQLGDRAFPLSAISRASSRNGRVPLVLAPHDLALDSADTRFGADGRRRSAFGLLQEYLNADAATLWGLVSNGRLLRLVRDNPSLTRPAFIEIDLERLFREGLYPSFQVFWLLLHRSRFGGGSDDPADCPLERWRGQSAEEGVRALGALRDGVEQALRALGTGFVAHPANSMLRERIAAGELSADALFQQLLRLVYRLIFLATTEERGSLHDPSANADARGLYSAGYSFAGLRERALHAERTDRHHDLWQGLKVTWRALARGEPVLGLPALGGLFAAAQCPDLDGAHIENRALLAAVRGLAYFRLRGSVGRVNYRDMDTEELGSVYESLLELAPRVTPGAPWHFGFAGDDRPGAGNRGNARKLSGSYYTPDSLVQQLIASALVPVIEQRLADHPEDPIAALLSLKVIDPAVGSGHFLLAAGRRIAAEVARLRAASGQPTPDEYRHALREVTGRCLFGVDLNPMAVELCRTALWLEAQEPGRPLGFLDAHIQCGNSLVGLFDPEALDDGIPDAAFKPLTGDARATCTELRKQNREQAKGLAVHLRMGGCDLAVLDAMPEDDLAAVEAKRAAWEQQLCTPDCTRDRWLADLWTAAFFLPKTPDGADAIPTNAHLKAAANDPQLLSPQLRQRVAAVAAEQRFLHWRLAFPQVFEGGGFDVVLGNPPWERIKLQEQEFFAERAPEIADARNKAARGRMIAALAQGDDPADLGLYTDFQAALRAADAASAFVRAGRFPLTATGDINVYALFAELFDALPNERGRAGVIVPTGIATDDGTKRFFSHLTEKDRIAALYSFENEEFIFPAVHHAYRFCLLVMRGRAEPAIPAELMFFLRQPGQVNDLDRKFSLTSEDFALINPNTRTCPVFRSQRDAELTKKLYRSAPVLIREAHGDNPEDNPWRIRFQRMMDMSNDSELFRTHEDLVRRGGRLSGNRFEVDGETWLPLVEAKMVHHYDHRWASYDSSGTEAQDLTAADKADPDLLALPRYWVREWEVTLRTARAPAAVLSALRDEIDPSALETALRAWAAGHAANQGDSDTALKLLHCDTKTSGFNEFQLDLVVASEREFPLASEEYNRLFSILESSPDDVLSIARDLLLIRRPCYLLGWRDITGVEKIRTVIGAILPLAAVGNSLPLQYLDATLPRRYVAAFQANLTSLIFDFVARHKVGGTHLNLFIYKQLPVLSANAYTESDLAYIVPRVLELTYTAWDLKPFAEDLGYDGPPFRFDPKHRHRLRCELDAYYARLYGLNLDELRYILDPKDVMGPDYPSETFRVLKNSEIKQFGEYRTRRLVLEAFDRLTSEATGKRAHD